MEDSLASAKAKFEAHFGGEFSRLLHRPTSGLYHYTRTANRVIDILRTRLMRAYCVDYMNDYAELRYAASIMRAHLDRALALEPLDEVAAVFEAVQNRMKGPITTRNVFVLSFSVQADDERMWRLYADRGKGANFAMPIVEIVNWAMKHNGLIVSVVYDPTELDQFCARSLGRLREICIEEKFGSADAGTLAASFLDAARWFAPVFKPSVYADENEWRVVFFRTDGHFCDETGRHYIEVPDPPIIDVSLGPACEASNRDFQRELLSLGFTRGFYRSRFDRRVIAHPANASRGGVA